MAKKQRSQSLASRKRAKDVSGAMFESTSFHSEAKSLLIDAPKKGFENAVPRKLREMQMAMQRMADREAGKTVTWRAHREDAPKPQSAASAGKHAKKSKANAKNEHTDVASSSSSSSHADINKGSSSGNNDANDAVTAEVEGLPRLVQRKPQQPPPQLSAPALAPNADRAAGQKRPRDEKQRAPKFGATNAAPPVLLVGGRLKKQAEAARGAAAREDVLQRQRAQVLQAYAAMKAARREDGSK